MWWSALSFHVTRPICYISHGWSCFPPWNTFFQDTTCPGSLLLVPLNLDISTWMYNRNLKYIQSWILNIHHPHLFFAHISKCLGQKSCGPLQLFFTIFHKQSSDNSFQIYLQNITESTFAHHLRCYSPGLNHPFPSPGWQKYPPNYILLLLPSLPSRRLSTHQPEWAR